MRFAHLHLHSEYSLVDSTIRIPELVQRCVALGQPALAITDHNALFALVKFYKAAEAAGIKPIAGADLCVAEPNEAIWRLTLLCRDRAGYLALSRLLTRAWMEGQRHDGAVVQAQWLREALQGGGLFALLGRASLPGKLALGGRVDQAEAWLADWQALGEDRLHLEMVRTEREGEDAFNAFALAAASRRGLPVVASNDVRFLDAAGFEAHEARVCIASGRVLDDPKRPRDYSAAQYLKSSEEMAALFADAPDAIDNALALATRCNLELTLGKTFLPAFPVPAEHTLDSWIRSCARDGLAERLTTHRIASGCTAETYRERLERELDVITSMGFPGYFLIVADFINWAKDHGIPVGPGRGSGAGSLVAWALSITDLDPIPYDLLFERFLNPERVSLPDFDIDFCMDRRDEVIDYVAAKYGRDRVSQIITYGSMAAKAVVRDTGRVLGHPYGFVDSIAKLIPNVLGICLDDALGESDAARGNTQLINPELVQRYQQEDSVRDLLDLARELEDLVRNAGKHAGGVVIAPAPLTDFCPLFAEHDSGGGGRHPVTQFDKDDVEAIGLVKFDFLGLRTLTIIDWAIKAINARHPDAPLDIATLPLDDADTYALFSRGETVAVFQFESRGMRELLKRALPDRFEDLIALVSLFRPGPMDLIPDYVERKHGRQSVAYPEPRLEPILGPTYGVMVYQEQVMKIAQVLAGYSLGNADLLRRAMGKKDHAQMAAERARFEAGAAASGVPVRTASHIFDLMAKFAGYGFNKSHAAGYALVSYQTAWLKAHHPADFMAAVLSSDMDTTDKVVAFLDEARAMQLTVLAPDANASTWMFEAMDARTIRYGLGAIKGVGRGACEAIAAARASGGAFTGLLDLCRRVDHGKLNKRALEALLLSGALDGLGRNRASLMAQLPEAMKAAEQLVREHAAGQVSLFGGASIEAPLTLTLPEREEWPAAQRLSGERDTLGHYLSGHPLDPYRDEMRAMIGHDLGELERLWERGSNARGETRGGRRPEMPLVLAGQVVSSRRKGDAQTFVQLDDGRGRIECGFFNETYYEHAALLTRDRILVLEGALREDEYSGGFSMRVRRAWDWHALFAQAAETLQLQVDLRVTDAWTQVEALLARHRPGPTPLHIELLQAGACGSLLLNGAHGVRVDADLLAGLRAQPGVRAAAVSLLRNWRGDGA